jgi:hypothetical protein
MGAVVGFYPFFDKRKINHSINRSQKVILLYGWWLGAYLSPSVPNNGIKKGSSFKTKNTKMVNPGIINFGKNLQNSDGAGTSTQV